MSLTGALCYAIPLYTFFESTVKSGNMWLLTLGVESTGTFSWVIFSASIFVLVALVLSMYLIFEHLSAYNQPEVPTYSPLLFGWSYFINLPSPLSNASYYICLVFFYMSTSPQVLPSFMCVFFFFQEQKFLIGLILMVPVYALESVSNIFIKNFYYFFVLFCIIYPVL